MSEERTQVIEKISYTHDAMIDLLIAQPMIAQVDVARHFGYTQGWVSRVIRSDAFRERLASRKTELTDPLLIQAVESQFEVLLAESLRILQEKVELPNAPADLVLKTAELSARALGYGAKNAGVQINQQFVCAMPEKAKTAEEWLAGRAIEAGPA